MNKPKRRRATGGGKARKPRPPPPRIDDVPELRPFLNAVDAAKATGDWYGATHAYLLRMRRALDMCCARAKPPFGPFDVSRFETMREAHVALEALELRMQGDQKYDQYIWAAAELAGVIVAVEHVFTSLPPDSDKERQAILKFFCLGTDHGAIMQITCSVLSGLMDAARVRFETFARDSDKRRAQNAEEDAWGLEARMAHAVYRHFYPDALKKNVGFAIEDYFSAKGEGRTVAAIRSQLGRRPNDPKRFEYEAIAAFVPSAIEGEATGDPNVDALFQSLIETFRPKNQGH